jgi:hypothetical protein
VDICIFGNWRENSNCINVDQGKKNYTAKALKLSLSTLGEYFKIVYVLTSLLSTLKYTKNPRVSKNEHFFVAINQNSKFIHLYS